MGPFVRLSTVSTLCISERTCICERISEPAAGIDLFVVYLLGDTFAEIVQNELFAFLQKLGVKPEDRIYDGYDTLIYLQKPKKK